MNRFVTSRISGAAALALAGWIALAACGGAVRDVGTSAPTASAAAPLTVTPVPDVATPRPRATIGPSAELYLATADGAVQLSIPAGALPEGIEAGAVKMSQVGAEDVPATFEGAGELLAFRLEPDGLQLLEPAMLEIRVENGGDGAPIVWHVSSGGEDPEGGPRVELMPATEVILDPEEGTATVRLEVDSFSWFVSRDRGYWLTLELGRPFESTVGRIFPVHTTTTMDLHSLRSTVSWIDSLSGVDKERVQSSDPVLPWRITEGVFQPRGALGDISQENSPGPTVVDGLIYTFNSGFSCGYAGDGFVEYRLNARYAVRTVELTRDITGDDAGLIVEEISERTWFDGMSIRVKVRCRDPQPTPTATPTPTPTATPTPTETPTPAFEQVTPSTLELGP